MKGISSQDKLSQVDEPECRIDAEPGSVETHIDGYVGKRKHKCLRTSLIRREGASGEDHTCESAAAPRQVAPLSRIRYQYC